MPESSTPAERASAVLGREVKERRVSKAVERYRRAHCEWKESLVVLQNATMAHRQNEETLDAARVRLLSAAEG